MSASNLFSSPSKVKNTRIKDIQKNIIDCHIENKCVSSRLFQRKDPESIVPEVIPTKSGTTRNKVFDILFNLTSRLNKKVDSQYFIWKVRRLGMVVKILVVYVYESGKQFAWKVRKNFKKIIFISVISIAITFGSAISPAAARGKGIHVHGLQPIQTQVTRSVHQRQSQPKALVPYQPPLAKVRVAPRFADGPGNPGNNPEAVRNNQDAVKNCKDIGGNNLKSLDAKSGEEEMDKALVEMRLGEEHQVNQTEKEIAKAMEANRGVNGPIKNQTLVAEQKANAQRLLQKNPELKAAIDQKKREQEILLATIPNNKITIDRSNAEHIVINRPDVNGSIIVNHTDQSAKSYHLPEFGIESDPSFNASKYSNHTRRNYKMRRDDLIQNHNATMGKKMTDEVVDIASNPNNLAFQTKYGYGRAKGSGREDFEKNLPNAIVILDTESNNGVVAVQNAKNSNEYDVKTAHPFYNNTVEEAVLEHIIQ